MSPRWPLPIGATRSMIRRQPIGLGLEPQPLLRTAAVVAELRPLPGDFGSHPLTVSRRTRGCISGAGCDRSEPAGVPSPSRGVHGMVTASPRGRPWRLTSPGNIDVVGPGKVAGSARRRSCRGCRVCRPRAPRRRPPRPGAPARVPRRPPARPCGRDACRDCDSGCGSGCDGHRPPLIVAGGLPCSGHRSAGDPAGPADAAGRRGPDRPCWVSAPFCWRSFCWRLPW